MGAEGARRPDEPARIASAQARAEAILRDNLSLLEQILDNMGSQVFLKDLDGRYLLANRQVEVESTIPHDAMIGRTDRELFPGSDVDAWEANDKEVLDGRRLTEYEEAFEGPEGVQVFLSQKFPLLDETGMPYALAGVSTNITDRKRAEEAVKAASRAKDEFLSRMSHELRTPLNAVIGFAQLLALDELTSEQKDAVHQILRGGQHLLDLINEVLDVAQIESGRLAISMEDVAVGPVVEEVVHLMQSLADRRKLQLLVGSGVLGGTAMVHADRLRLKQVVLNLMSNAVKYTPDGGTVMVWSDEPDPTHLAISVRDTGAGIAPEHLDVLFEPFERATAAAGIEGSGLGLALARGLAEAMGGTLGVTSQVGAGSTFTLVLSKATGEVHELARSAPRKGAESPSSPGGTPVPEEPERRALVLYVEDNVANMHLVQSLVDRRPGVELLTAMTGTSGVEMAREHQPAMILLDLHLPDLHGSEVLGHLRREPSTRQIPVVVISADASEGEERRLRAAGAAAYLTKPLAIGEFYSVLDKVLATGGAPVGGAPGYS